jgi:hypothetical protein
MDMSIPRAAHGRKLEMDRRGNQRHDAESLIELTSHERNGSRIESEDFEVVRSEDLLDSSQ